MSRKISLTAAGTQERDPELLKEIVLNHQSALLSGRSIKYCDYLRNKRITQPHLAD